MYSIMNSTDIYCCENFWVIFYQHEVLIAMVCFGDNVYSFSWKFISQKRNPKKKSKTCYNNRNACQEIEQSEKVCNLTLYTAKLNLRNRKNGFAKFKSQITNVLTNFLTTKPTALHTRLLWLFRRCEKLGIRDWEFNKSCCLWENN